MIQISKTITARMVYFKIEVIYINLRTIDVSYIFSLYTIDIQAKQVYNYM